MWGKFIPAVSEKRFRPARQQIILFCSYKVSMAVTCYPGHRARSQYMEIFLPHMNAV